MSQSYELGLYLWNNYCANVFAITDGGSGGNNDNIGITDNNVKPLNYQHGADNWVPYSYIDGFGNTFEFETSYVNGQVLYRIDANDTPRNWDGTIKDVIIYTYTQVSDAQSSSFSKEKGADWEYYIGNYNNGDGLPQVGVMWGHGNQFNSNGYNGTSFYVGTGSFAVNNPSNGRLADLPRGITVGMKF